MYVCMYVCIYINIYILNYKFLPRKCFLIHEKDKNHIDFCYVSVKGKNRSE